MSKKSWQERFTDRVSRDCKWCGEHILVIPALMESGRIEVQIVDGDPDPDGWVHVDPAKRMAYVNRWDIPEGVTSYFRHDCRNFHKG